MDRSQDKLLLKKILSRYDQLGVIRRRIEEGDESSSSLEKLRRQSRKKINEINRELREQESSGPLWALLSRYRLNKYQLVLVLALLRQRLTSSQTSITGRDLLQLIFDDSFGMLKGMSYIDPSSVLVGSGIIVPELDDEDSDLLDQKFKLSDQVFSMVYKTFAPAAGRQNSALRSKGKAYNNNLSFLMDYRKLALLYQKRATKVFNYDYWDEVGLGVAETAHGVNKQIQRMGDHIKARVEKTKTREKLHLLNFIRKNHLSEIEVVVIITLLFQELTEGNAYLNAVDLVRLVSKNEQEILKNRRFFSSDKTLIKKGLVLMEENITGKELTGEVCLPNWVIEMMVSGKVEKSSRIDADTRLDFHNYLNDLESSEDFLDDLDSF